MSNSQATEKVKVNSMSSSGRHAGRKAGRQEGRQTGRQVDGQAGQFYPHTQKEMQRDYRASGQSEVRGRRHADQMSG